ncbi:carboxylating nicotinate-nucleotide diphosphorylase [Thiomicrospira cyclica]|uniref:Probable nicotinate-nucleotide pyrophosphorylase [carboxylating] n=1 Tax=Thiomicrospira cyclica (strain DSM 14477 / JCM 11371 / ALM1) TaxID=717773 RepID=F6DC80_THICA|nr:carboxylating nicotinate-nucleotide diphosphorylase [Thiomicrospira cyclica]AEG31466.1 nicotinate-nucleotide pyrophosphorylase [Thiomicrospira cyclica ALM1]
MKKLDYHQDLVNNVRQALTEDLRQGDLTANLIAADAQLHAKVICRESAVLCGQAWFNEVFHQLDPEISIHWLAKDSDRLAPNQTLCEVRGNARALLTGERTALNFLQTLSATATITAQYVAAMGSMGNTKTQLLDTRKTLPGLRLAQKYAVFCGGGCNHRQGLYDAILIKENHIHACGGISAAIKQAQTQQPGISIEVETESLAEVAEALTAGADIIMLDNFSREDIQAAVTLNQGQAKLEVSGNVELAQLAELAQLGVDYISTGAITKHIQAIDLSMRFNEA